MSGPGGRVDTLERQLYEALERHSRAWAMGDHELWRESLRVIIRTTKLLGYMQRAVDEQRARLTGVPVAVGPWDDEETPAEIAG